MRPQTLPFWTRSFRMCVLGPLRQSPWSVQFSEQTLHAWQKSDGYETETSYECPCRVWRNHQSWNSNWNPTIVTRMNAELATVQEHPRAPLMFLVSEFYVSVTFYSTSIIDLMKTIKNVLYFLCFQQLNPTMLNSTLTHLTRCVFWREIIIPTTCSGHKKILKPQNASSGTG